MKGMNILCSTDRNFLYPTYVTMYSVIANHPDFSLTFYLLTDEDVSEEEKEKLAAFIRSEGHRIEFIAVDPAPFADYVICERFPLSAYYRLSAHRFLPAEADRVLYLDGDVIVNADIYDDFYRLDFNGKHLIAASHNPDPAFYNLLDDTLVDLESAAKGEFFNSGVLLMNLDLFRKNDLSPSDYKAAYQSAERQGFKVFYDQGLLNYMFYDKTLYLSSMDFNYRFSIPKDYARRLDPKRKYKKAIVHYTGMKQPYKPWDLVLTEEEIALYGTVPYSNDYFYVSKELFVLFALWWSYAGKTPVYEALRREAEIKTKWFRRNLLDFTLRHNAAMDKIKGKSSAPPEKREAAAEEVLRDFHPKAYRLGCLLLKPFWALKRLFARIKARRQQKKK